MNIIKMKYRRILKLLISIPLVILTLSLLNIHKIQRSSDTSSVNALFQPIASLRERRDVKTTPRAPYNAVIERGPGVDTDSNKDAPRPENDGVEVSNDGGGVENDRVKAENDKGGVKNDKVKIGNDGGELKKDRVKMSNDEAGVENDIVYAENDGGGVKNDQVKAENDGGEVENDRVKFGNDGGQPKNDRVKMSNDGGGVENDRVRAENNGGKIKSDGVNVEIDGSKAGTDGIQTAIDGVKAGREEKMKPVGIMADDFGWIAKKGIVNTANNEGGVNNTDVIRVDNIGEKLAFTGEKAEKNGKMGECFERTPKLAEVDLPLTAMISFPGSGSTWVRHLVQQMTGLATSSVYCDKDLRDSGFPFECHLRKQRTVLVKTHERRPVQRYHRAILLVRNPYDALLAYYNFVKGDHKKTATDFVLRKASHELFNHAIRWWLALSYETLQTFKNRVYILQYETLKENTKETLTDLARFLEIPVSEHDVTCTLRLQEGRHHRQTSMAEHLRLLNVVYDKPKLKKLREAAKKTEDFLKAEKNRSYNISGDLEKRILEYKDNIFHDKNNL